MIEAEHAAFVKAGQDRLTNLNHAIRQLKDWADAFEQRGGGGEFGGDATQIVYISNAVQALLTPERLATIARLRTDI